MARKDFFRSDNPFNEMLTLVFNLIELNLLWLLSSVPLITIGASTSALYRLCFRLLAGRETSVIKEYGKTFKENFVPGIPYSVAMLLFGGILAADFHILGGDSGRLPGIFYGICLVLLSAGVSVFSYALPLFSRYENTFAGTMNNAWRLAASKLPRTLVLLLIHGLPWALLIIVPGIFFHVFWIWVLAGEAVGAYLSTMVLRPVFDELEKTP